MLRRILGWLAVYVVLTIVLPIAMGTALSLARGWPDNWRSANWTSSGLLAEARNVPEAKVLILASRTGRWKSIFAEHLSIVLKPRGAAQWTRYDVVGWGNPVRRDAYAADAYWYGNRPYVVKSISGPEAEKLIPAIEMSIDNYPGARRGSYVVWPGPNSNSFVAPGSSEIRPASRLNCRRSRSARIIWAQACALAAPPAEPERSCPLGDSLG